MKRFLIGAALLAALLLGSILVTHVLGNGFDPMEEQMHRASQAALEENWPQALTLARQIQQNWQSRWAFTAMFSDHEPMERISGLFARLEVYGQEQQAAAYAALCAQLAQELSDLGEEHLFTWWNLL